MKRRRSPDWQRLAPVMLQYGWQVLVATVLIALVAGVVYPASRTQIPEDPLLQSFDCASPPCFPQTTASRLGDLLVRLPPIGYTLALLLCVPALLVGVRYVMAGQDAKAGPAFVAFFGTLTVLVGTDILPHVLNPCLGFGPRLDGLCGEFAGRWDVQERWHTLLHTLFGAIPFTVLLGWFTGRLKFGPPPPQILEDSEF